MTSIGKNTIDEYVIDYLLKYPFRHCIPALLGVPGATDNTTRLRNASATLMTFAGKPRVITCAHVLEAYRESRRKDATSLFQIGEAPIDPETLAPTQDNKADLAILDAKDLTYDRTNPELPTIESYQVKDWPPNEVRVGDIVIFGGWPEVNRSLGATDYDVVQDSYSLAATDVTDVFDRHFYCTFDRSGWLVRQARGSTQNLNLSDLSGLSGCPVMRIRNAAGEETLRPEIIGFVSEYDARQDKLVVMSAHNIKSDGRFWRPTS